MIIKKILKRIEYSYEDVLLYSSEEKSDLSLLELSFNPCHDWILVEKFDEKVCISTDFFLEDSDLEDVSKLIMSKKNYDEVLHAWNKNIEDQAPFLILTQDDSGWITLEAKQELSKVDLRFVEEENQKYEDLKKQGRI